MIDYYMNDMYYIDYPFIDCPNVENVTHHNPSKSLSCHELSRNKTINKFDLDLKPSDLLSVGSM